MISRMTTIKPLAFMGVIMPWLAKVAPNLIGWSQLRDDLPSTFNFLRKYTKEKLETYKGDGGNPQNFIEVSIDEMRRCTNPQSSFYGSRGELTLAGTLADVFEAGSDTTSTTLTWMCLYLSVYPEVQQKVHNELDQVLGSTFPTISDRPRLPYLESTIFETLRFSTLLPLGLFHRTTEEIQLGGYTIPKDILVGANFHAVHFDPVIWGDPASFRPDRFLSPDGKTAVRGESLFSFSSGRRVCIGENLALLQLFIFSANILQQFKISHDPNGPRPSLDQIVGAFAAPFSHKLIFTERL